MERYAVSVGAGRRTGAGSSAIVLALAFTSGCAPGTPTTRDDILTDGAITVASFDFDESVIVAEIYAQALEAAGFRIERALDVGPRELVEPSLQRGLVEFVPEYLGTALLFLGADEVPADPEAARVALAAELASRDVVALEAAPAQDANGVAVTREVAKRFGLRTISDLALVADDLVFGGPPECPDRPLCLQGLEETYGLEFEAFVALDASGPVTVAALEGGEVDVALLFTTSGYLAGGTFVLLEDDLGLQPPENVVPVVRSEVIAEHGAAFAAVVAEVSRALTTEELASLNRSVSIVGRGHRLVARDWLATNGIGG